jgi:hypothetical protein
MGKDTMHLARLIPLALLQLDVLTTNSLAALVIVHASNVYGSELLAVSAAVALDRAAGGNIGSEAEERRVLSQADIVCTC